MATKKTATKVAPKKAATKAAPKKAAAKQEKREFTFDTCQYLANEVNRFHGSGGQCAIAFNEVTLVPLAGVVASTSKVPGYFTIACRDRWDGQYAPQEISELVN